jgi:hypothetical protein
LFARSVSLNLKPDSFGEFTRTIDKEIFPLLRKQRGFQDEIMFLTAGGSQAVGISLWEAKEDAEAYAHKTYPEVMKILARFVEGVPQVQIFGVTNSTFHKIAVPVTA